MRILIVDDEKLDLFIAKKLLSMEFSVEAFATIAEAEEYAKGNEFDVALIDYYLAPPTLGDEVLRRLRSIRGDSFRAYLLTNYIDKDQADRLLSEGFNGILTKPITIEGFKSLPH